jgi:hypothetical protein
MSHNPNIPPEHVGWKEYKELLGFVGTSFMIVAVAVALISTIAYCVWISRIEQIGHRSLSPSWICLLLWFPIAIQLIVFLRLKKRISQAISENRVRAYFKFYFWRMAFSLVSYTLLWGTYVILFALGADSWVIWAASWLPPMGIAVLLGIIVHATYLITKTSFHDDEYLLREGDVKSKYLDICSTLKSSPTKEIESIREWLRKDRDCKIHRVTLKKEVGDLDVGHLTEALNRLICSEGFFEAAVRPQLQGWNPQSHNVLPTELETFNRDYLDAYLLSIKPSSSSKGNKQPTVKERKKERRDQERLVRQKEQQDGIALFPFYTMVFFFSIFLCIAYIFAFAFAFEDRQVQGSHRLGPVALFMGDDLLEDDGKFSVATASPTPLTYQLIDRQKLFYFTSGGAGITTETPNGDLDPRLRHIARINNGSLNSLAESIKVAVKSGRLRISLIGRADDNSVDKVAYASNYEIAGARVNSVRYLLQEKLIGDGVSPTELAAIEWTGTPFSNDRTLAPKERKSTEASKISLVLNNDVAQMNKARIDVPREFTNNLDREIWNSGGKEWKNEVRDFLERLKALSKGVVPLANLQRILDDIHTWDALRAGGNTVGAEKLGDDIDAELYEIEDPAGRKRAVEVYIYNQLGPSHPPLAQRTQAESKRMALLDYLYFATYTITTTGYGDIKPMTPYAKFLCTLANMTEFFFIVVFFNTLLSLKRAKSEMG